MAIDTTSEYIFDYLNDVWDLLPESDRVIFGETWKAYEQTYGYTWMQQFEIDLANTITNLPLYNIKRWLQHEFDSTTQLNLAATFTSSMSIAPSVDLEDRYLIKFSIDGETPIEVDLQGSVPATTYLFEIVNKINVAQGATVAFAIDSNQLLEIKSSTQGPTSSIEFFPASDPTKDASAIVLGLDPVSQLPLKFPTFPYAYQLGETDIVHIPTLQNTIHYGQITTLLTENVDFQIEFGTGIIIFAEIPPQFMWAPDTLCNLETPYNNFGYLMGIYDTNTTDYLKEVKGLWYAYWTGPRPENIKTCLYLLFGLPTASEDGTVTAVTDTTISLAYTDATTETFNIPPNLTAIVVAGQAVTQFQPLVSGINVYDKINYPGFLAAEAGRPAVQPFLTQFATRGSNPDTDESMALNILEETTYLPQINVNAFISPTINVTNVQTFLRSIQPKSRTYLLQILIGLFQDLLFLSDEGATPLTTDNWPNGQPALGLNISFDATYNIDWNLNTMGNQSTWDEAEDNPYTYLTLDDMTIKFGDFAQIDVYQSAVLIDSFTLEG